MWRILLQLLIPMLAGANETTQGPFANPFGSPFGASEAKDDDPVEVDAEVYGEDGRLETEKIREEWDRKTAGAPTLEGAAIPKWRMPFPACGPLPFIVMIVIGIAVGLVFGLVLKTNPAVAVAFGVMAYALLDDLRSRSPYGPFFLILAIAAIAARIWNLYHGAVFTSVVVPAVVGLGTAILVSLALLFFIERKETRDTFFAKEADVLAIIALSIFAGWSWLICGIVTLLLCGLVNRYAGKKLPVTAILYALAAVEFFVIGFAGI